jgi:hypothetical protein
MAVPNPVESTAKLVSTAARGSALCSISFGDGLSSQIHRGAPALDCNIKCLQEGSCPKATDLIRQDFWSWSYAQPQKDVTSALRLHTQVGKDSAERFHLELTSVQCRRLPQGKIVAKDMGIIYLTPLSIENLPQPVQNRLLVIPWRSSDLRLEPSDAGHFRCDVLCPLVACRTKRS